MFLFNEIIDILVEIFPPKNVCEEYLGYYKIPTPESEISLEFNTTYPFCSKNLTNKFKAIIIPTIALKKILLDLSDYSFMVYPIFRCLEGVMKMIYSENGITIINKDGFRDYFKYNSTKNQYECDTETTNNVICKTTCDYLEKMYNIYNNHRHSLFHTDAINPRIISNRNEAISMIDNVLNLLEEFFIKKTNGKTFI